MSRGKSSDIDWNEIFRYEESSPSGLCWNKDVLRAYEDENV